MKTVAASRTLNQAIEDLGNAAADLLQQVHEGLVPDPRTAADEHLHAVREFARCMGIDLHDVPAWQRHITSWRAIARLAGSAVISEERTQAG